MIHRALWMVHQAITSQRTRYILFIWNLSGQGVKNVAKSRGQFLKDILSPLVILSMEKTMVTKVISELKSVSRLKIFPETGPWSS